jgi:hypothetical protein
MASDKISALSNYTTPIVTDLLAIVDVTTNTTKKIQVGTLFNTQSGIILTESLEILHVDILHLGVGDTPKLIIPNPGEGKVVSIISNFIQTKGVKGVFIPYTGNTALELITDTAASEQFINNGALNSISEIIGYSSLATSFNTTQLIPNKGVYVDIRTGNPTGGVAGQSIKIFVTYQIVTL